MKYENHLGEVIEFGQNGIYVNYNDFRDYQWEYTSKYGRVRNFSRKITEKSIPLVVMVPSKMDPTQFKNDIFEVFEKDVISNKYGKFIIGDYYMQCYVIGSKKTNYLIDKRYNELSLSIVTDKPYWVKETTRSYIGAKNDITSNVVGTALVGYAVVGSGDSYSYPYSYPYGYESYFKSNKSLVNNHYEDTDFIMIINGKILNPVINIGSHKYMLNYDIAENEYVVIDSSQKTITLFKNDKTQVNIFNYRNKENYIFQKIPMGEQSVSWNGEFDFSITLIEKRSEPKWI